MASSDRLKFVAELQGVREVSLAGFADFGYWRKALEPEGLLPVESDGHAQLMIVAADATFRGLRSQELSFSVLAARADNWGEPGAFLVQAFNSRRFFAFCERWLFKTPYTFGEVIVESSLRAGVRFAAGQNARFHAQMGTDSGEKTSDVDGGWEGPIYLPSQSQRRARKFFGCIRGETVKVAFRDGLDSWSSVPSEQAGVLQQLVDSGFAPVEWQIRPNAYHAKSKTYADDRPIR